MALTAPQFQAWLENPAALRCILVEVVVNIGGTETLLYLSNRTYNTGPSDTPANTSYAPIVQTSLSYTQTLPLDGTPSLSYGDIAIDNTNGIRDSWLSYTWANRQINVYLGDVSFTRADFTKIYSGYVADIASSNRNTLNISIRDILQKLNSPITSTLVGGTDQNNNQLRPLVFGEVHNITPILISSASLKYMVHNGPIERIIEVRDNGVPIVSYTPLLSEGCFQLTKAPAGVITCSVQGERSGINKSTGTLISHNYSTQALVWSRSLTVVTITHTSHGLTTGSFINITDSSNITSIPLNSYSITVINANSYSIICNNAGDLSGSITISSYVNTVPDIIQLILLKYGSSPLTAAEIDLSTFNTFSSSNTAPVGIYITSNSNVISTCQDLATSIGSQFTSTRTGLVTLLKLDIPTAGSISITDDDILLNSVSIEQKIPVQCAIKLNYCKNWTVQTQLLTGIPEAHKIMLGLEYLTTSVSDISVQAAYGLSSEVQAKNTYMISNTPSAYVSDEANRLLALWKVPRYVYKIETTSKYLTLKLGDMINLTHYRFGLATTKYGQVVSVSINWDTGRITFGVMV